ncbi:MAG: hypothetical protein N2645_14550 [Clostridia bacterium]|nr:hypothetical protein [Clostridia bacterium]
MQINKNGDFYNVNSFVANEGFISLGWETFKFYDIKEIRDKSPKDIVVGGIGNIRSMGGLYENIT